MLLQTQKDKFLFITPCLPRVEVYKNVTEFEEIIDKDSELSTGGFLCINCKGLVMSSHSKNNQRAFSNHLNKCIEFSEKNKSSKNAVGEKSDDTSDYTVANAVPTISSDSSCSKPKSEDRVSEVE